jgi:outer membrane protein assembly factor BamB
MSIVTVCGIHLASAVASEPAIPIASKPLFGSTDWKPSPTDTVGFCGQQNNNWYPGATPPLEWWDGTPAKVKTRKAVPFYPGEYDKEFETDGFADSKSKNILWKSPVPGWGDSLPLAVGHRVITLSSPHYVTCWDAHTGKVLWQDELKLMTVPVLNADRKTVGPAPDPAAAANAQNLFERVLGYTHVRLGATAFNRDFKDNTKYRWTARAPLLQHAIEVIEKWKTELAANHPDIVPSIEAEQALLRDCLNNVPQKERQDRGLPGQRSFGGGYAGSAVWVYAHAPDLQTYAMKKLGLQPGHFINGWGAWVCDTAATPVSDGEVVCVMFGHGQMAVYEVATGKRLWTWRDPQMNASSVSHLPSPMIWKDLMIFMAAGRGTEGGTKYSTTMMAVDKRTGTVRWEVPSGPGGCVWGGSHGDHMSPLLLRLGDRAVVVSNLGKVLDPETGATLAQLPKTAGPGNAKGHWQTGHMLGIGDRLLRGAASDGGPTPISVWPLRFVGGKLEVNEGFTIPARSDQGAFSANDRVTVVSGKLFDLATGQPRAQLPREVSTDTTLVGNWLISPQGHSEVEMRREDIMSIANFTVIDVTDPAAPRPLSNRSRLGGPQTPADIADKYFPEFRKPELKRFALGGYLGLGAFFGHRVGGLTAQGERLFIRSQTHLYCIGPAVKGAATDDPQIVAAIRAGQDVAKYLDSESAQYRFEAVQKASADSPALRRLAAEDPYEEIRAGALRKLGLETGKPGFVILRDLISKEIVAHHESHRHEGLGDTVMTLKVLGADADPVLVSLLTDPDAKIRRNGAAAAGLWPSGSATVRDALLVVAADRKMDNANRGPPGSAFMALANWPADPAVTAEFQKIVANEKEWGFHGPAVQYLMRVLPEDRKDAVLATACKGYRGETYVTQLLERNATETIKALVAGTKDRLQSGIVVALAQAATTPAQRQFAVEMAVLALREPSKDPQALGGLAAWIKPLGADAAPVLPLLKGLKIEDANTAKTVADAIAEIESKVAAAAEKK